MAVAYDSSSANADSTPGTSVSWTHVNGASATCITMGGGSPTVSSATYAGDSMTLIQQSGTNRWVHYYKAGPATGSNTLTVNFGNSDNFTGIAISVSGSDTTSAVIGDTGTSEGTGTSAGVTLTTSSSDSLIVDVIIMNGSWTAGSETADGTNQTNRVSCEIFGNDLASHGSTMLATGGSDSTTWSWTGSVGFFTFAVELLAGATPTPSTSKPRVVFFN